MKPIIICCICSILLGGFITSCNKNPEPPLSPEPPMRYIQLADTFTAFQQPPVILDLDGDRRYDLIFSVLYVGDALHHTDKHQFMVQSAFDTYLAVNNAEETPSLPGLTPISTTAFNGYQWYNASGIVLMEKRMHVSGSIAWQGNWLQVSRQYLPLQIHREGKRYTGWVELSADAQQQRIVLHRAAISTLPEQTIRAGR